MKKLTPYQIGARAAVDHYWEHENSEGRPMVELGTGLGKSLFIADTCKATLETYPGVRIGIGVHVKELVQQNAAELLSYWPQAPIGINSAGLGRRDTRSRILVFSIQSVYRNPEKLAPFDMLIIDEAQLQPARSDAMYSTFIAKCRERVPDMRLLQTTATPFRTDSGRMDRGPKRLADKIVYSYNIAEGVRDGYLAPLISKPAESQNSTTGVRVVAGKFVDAELEEAAIPNVRPAVAELVHWGRTEQRSGWLVFAAGVKHAEIIRDEVRRHGVSCDVITGSMPHADRDRIIRDYKAKQITCLVSVNCILTGFNAPHVDLLGWMRDTLSPVIWVQGNGRGTRVVTNVHGMKTARERLEAIASSLKPNCRVLDFTRNGERLGPVDAISLRERSSAEPDEKIKADDIRGKHCPQCEELLPLAVRSCQFCGFAYPEPKIHAKHEAMAHADRPIMASTTVPKWVEVSAVRYARALGKGGKAHSFKVSYRCGLAYYDKRVFFEHPKARKHCEKWWREMAGAMSPTPDTVTEALDRIGELRQPAEILLRFEDKHWNVSAYAMQPRRREEAA